MRKIVIVSLLLASYLSASIEIYQDKAMLHSGVKETFIGFNNSLEARDIKGRLELEMGNCLFDAIEACKPFKRIANWQHNNQHLKNEKASIEAIVQKYNPKDVNASKVIAYIEAMQKKISTIIRKIKHNTYRIQKERRLVPYSTQVPYSFKELPTGEVELRFSGINFRSHYLLDVKNKQLLHTLHVSNNSGIAITNTKANMYDSRLQFNHYNSKFTPLIIYTNQARLQKRSLRAQSMEISNDAVAGYAQAKSVAYVEKKAARVYTIENFSLKALEKKKIFIVEKKVVKLRTTLEWKAWQNSVYEVARISLDEVVESNTIDVRYHQQSRENVPVRKEAGIMYLNLAKDFSLKVERTKLPKYTQDRGLFNSDEESKSGYTLGIANLSQESKNVDIIERIPVSTNAKIDSTLEGVWLIKGNKRLKTAYSFDKKLGKLGLHVKLKPQETLSFSYEFSIKHPKEMPIRFEGQ